MSESLPVMRRIRSFVKREGRMTSAQQRALEELWPRYGVDPGQPLDFRELFQRDCPVVLEIGFGNGESLAGMAAENPDRCYLGVEVHRPGVGSLLLNIERLGLTNLRLSMTDSVELLQTQIPDKSLAAVQVYFPDPWPKARHHKRRLIQSNFVQLLRQKLKPGGTLHLATDWPDYAEHMLSVMEDADGFTNVAGPGKWLPRPAWRPETKFERRGLRLGHPVHDLMYTCR
jgi:tRNA (guanine-N7-)-methyltransferase